MNRHGELGGGEMSTPRTCRSPVATNIRLAVRTAYIGELVSGTRCVATCVAVELAA
ncbi:MAG: hypothetical protein U0805_06450 [Pirellulales bacterium]